MRNLKRKEQLRRDHSDKGRGAALATLRWVLGGAPVAHKEFVRGFDALPQSLQPLAADFGLRHLDTLEGVERKRLTDIVRRATITWLARRSVVRDVRSALDDVSVPAVFLKAVALAEQVYPRPATRLGSDIDVWIRPGDLTAAIDSLSKRGFLVPPRHLEASDPHGPSPTTYLETHLSGGPVLVDLHVRPNSLRELTDEEVNEMWATRGPVGPLALPVLPLDVQLAHVCLHAARSHAFVSGLKALVDVAMIARSVPDNGLWESFVQRVVAVRADQPVFVCVELARELLDAAVPGWVLDRLRTEGAAALVDQAREMLWAREPKLPLGVIKLVGGGPPESSWLRNRLWLRIQLTSEERQRLAPTDRPEPRLILRYFLRRFASLAQLIIRGEAFRPSFWRRVGVERRKRRLLEDLNRLNVR